MNLGHRVPWNPRGWNDRSRGVRWLMVTGVAMGLLCFSWAQQERPAVPPEGVPQRPGSGAPAPPGEALPAKPPVPLPVKPPAVLPSAVAAESKLINRVEEFLKQLKKGQTPYACAKLFEGSPMMQQREAMDRLVGRIDSGLAVSGRIEDFEAVSVISASRAVKELVYIAHGEHRPLRWRFIGYFSAAKWQILAVDFTADLDSFFPATVLPSEFEPERPPE